MRSPSMTAPLPVTSAGACLVQGRAGSGRSTVANTLTTLLLVSPDALSVGTGAAAAAAATALETMRQRIQASFRFTCRPFRSIHLIDDAARLPAAQCIVHEVAQLRRGRGARRLRCLHLQEPPS